MRLNETLYTNGSDYFESLFAALENAKSEILLETYIFKEGELTEKLYEKLSTALKRGVLIKITVDGAGTYGDRARLLEFCKLHNITLRIFHPIVFSDLLNSFKFLNRRNHRKLCIVDSELVFVGSLNFSDEHVREIDGAMPWKDYGLSFSGDGVVELKLAFEKTFVKGISTQKIKTVLLRQDRNNFDCGVLLNDSVFKRREVYSNLVTQIKNAKKRICLANAYIVPELKLLKHLKDAARRGVEVQFLTSGDSSDVFFMPWLTRLSYKKCLQAGIQLFEYKPSFFHGKVFIIDDYYTVGSSNLNHRSLLHDLELDVEVQSVETRQSLVSDIDRCLADSSRITLEDLKKIPIWQNLVAHLFYLFKYWV